MSYKVGDKVRVVTNKSIYYGGFDEKSGKRFPMNGDVGVVTGFADGHVVVRISAADVSPVNNIGDEGWRFIDEWLEPLAPVAPSPKFNVGDRVKITHPSSIYFGKSGVVDEVRIRRNGVRYSVFDDSVRAHMFGDYDEKDVELYVAPTPIVWTSSTAKHIDQAKIDEWVREGVETLKANAPSLDAWPNYASSSGDALVHIDKVGENSFKVRLYRLEATANVE